MNRETLPTPEDLRNLFRYEPDTGKLFWRERGPEWFEAGKQTPEHNAAIWNGKFAGKQALTSLVKGYRAGKLFNRPTYAHRVAYAVAHGKWPTHQVDHINGDRSDNRLANLREVTGAENAKNAGLPVTNSSGVVGVLWLKRERIWCARIRTGNKRYTLGYFHSKDDAVVARKAAEQDFGFYANKRRGS